MWWGVAAHVSLHPSEHRLHYRMEVVHRIGVAARHILGEYSCLGRVDIAPGARRCPSPNSVNVAMILGILHWKDILGGERRACLKSPSSS